MFRTGVVPDSVAAWYRRWFRTEGWNITGDVRMADGSVALHADKSGRPLWIMARPGGSG
ncbi:MAG: hypothetical protein HY560_00695, partial [Gemmatimonadetes bacterium]|nr:hypothetical protein [Gemmatimonadota bacterium]